jgi:nitroreductase
MELYEIMHTTFAARDFTGDPLPDDVLYRILDHARFGPSGGNRQGWRVIVVRDRKTREAIADLTVPAAKRYTAQTQAGENPWNTVDPSSVDDAAIERTPAMPRLLEPVLKSALVLVLCVDLKVVAATDQYLPRVGIVGGASIYPFAWNIMMAARHEGFAANITTLAVAAEPRLKALLGIPPHIAVASVMPMGRPVRSLTKLKRKPVQEFATLERWGGAPLAAPAR